MTRIKAGEEACSLRIRNFSTHNPFPLKPDGFEVQQESQFQIRDREITDHLGEMRVMESYSDFGIYYNNSVDDQIRLESPDDLLAIVNGKSFLLFDLESTSCQFNYQGVFVEFFVQSRSQSVE